MTAKMFPPRFRLASFLVVVTLMGTALSLFVLYRRANAAATQCTNVASRYNMGAARPEDVYRASLDLLAKSLELPWTNRKRAYADHLARMHALEARAISMTHGVSGATHDEEKQIILGVRGWREEAQHWAKESGVSELSVPAADTAPLRQADTLPASAQAPSDVEEGDLPGDAKGTFSGRELEPAPPAPESETN